MKPIHHILIVFTNRYLYFKSWTTPVCTMYFFLVKKCPWYELQNEPFFQTGSSKGDQVFLCHPFISFMYSKRENMFVHSRTASRYFLDKKSKQNLHNQIINAILASFAALFLPNLQFLKYNLKLMPTGKHMWVYPHTVNLKYVCIFIRLLFSFL